MAKYTVTLHIQREDDGRETILHFDDNQVAEIADKEGVDFGRLRLVPEGLPTMSGPTAPHDFSGCLAYCTIDDKNSLPYCLAICAAGS